MISRMSRGIAAAAVLLTAVLAVATSGSAAARPARPHPHVAAVTNGRMPSDVAADYTGDCELANVTCKPNRPGSCTGDTSQTTFPATIRVLVRTPHHASFTIESVPFETYVENVLPNEWLSSWDGDALKAGAVAVKSYAWYWHTHFGGYANGDPAQCFDVTDDQDFQTYRAGSATSRTTSAVESSWPYVARIDGQVLQASYRDDLTGNKAERCGAGANGMQLSQYGSQACIDSDLHRGGSTGNKFNVILHKYYYPGLQLSTPLQLRTPDDFSFQQASSRAFFHSGEWTISDGYGTTVKFGRAGDIPTVFDDGTGFAHVGYFRPSSGNWYVATPTGAIASTVHLGAKGDIPVQANYDGDDQPTVPAVYDPDTSTWTIEGQSPFVLGQPGDIPVPGHYTASSDETDQPAVWNPKTQYWYIDGTATPIKFGQPGDIPAPADYDGNGTTDLAIYRPASHKYWVRHSDGSVTSVQIGSTGDVPVSGDFTGDGKADYVVYRPSNQTWYGAGLASHRFGGASGQPIGKAPQPAAGRTS